MLKKFFVVLLISLPFLAGGYWYYQSEISNSYTLPELIPSNTIAVFTLPDIEERIQRMQEAEFYQSLSSFPFFQQIERFKAAVDSTETKKQTLLNQPLAIGLHKTARSRFGYVYYFPYRPKLKQYIENFLKDPAAFASGKYQERVFEDAVIRELKMQDRTLTFFQVDNFLMLSEDAFLIEDIIRERNSINEQIRLPEKPFLKSAVYLNLEKASNFVKLFLDTTGKKWEKVVSDYSGYATLDFDFAGQFLSWSGNGFWNDSTGVSNQQIEFDSWSIVPNRTSMVLQRPATDYWGEYSTEAKAFQRLYNLDPQSFKKLSGNLFYLQFESYKQQDPEEVVVVDPRDQQGLLAELRKLSERAAQDQNDSIYQENFEGIEVREIGIRNFLPFIYGDFFENHAQVFYSVLGRYILLSSDLATLKTAISDINNDETWGRSVAMSKWLDKTLDVWSRALMINTEAAWNYLQKILYPEWWSFLREHQPDILNFVLAGVQETELKSTHFINGFVFHEPRSLTREGQPIETIVRTNFSQKLITQPFASRNTRSNSFEFLVQDSLFNLHSLNDKGEAIWQRSLNSKLQTDILTFDYYKNGLTQLLFATRDSVYAIDREGNEVEGYPFALPNGVQIKWLSLVDYDGNKNYRLFIGTDLGNLWLTDKTGKVLSGWDGLTTGGRLAFAPFHSRIRGKDYMIAILQDGSVQLRSRRGEPVSTLAVEMDRPAGGYFLQKGTNIEKSEITLVSERGELVRFNLAGEIVYREQLFRPSESTRFALIPDGLRNTYIISRRDFSRLSILDRSGNALFEKDYALGNSLEIQYYRFSAANQIVAVTDQDQDFTYLYDQEGNFINFQPFNNSYPLALIYSEANETYKIYYAYGSTFTISVF